MLREEVMELKNNFIPFNFEFNYLAVRFFLIRFPVAYALDYLLKKLTLEELEKYFDTIFNKELIFLTGSPEHKQPENESKKI